MLFTLLRTYAIWFLVSIGVGGLGTLLTIISAPEQTSLFVASYFYHWNGVMVATSGFGALHFAVYTHKNQFHYLVSEILNLDHSQSVHMHKALTKLYSFTNKHMISIPILLVGSSILYLCGYPMTGIPSLYLWLCSSFMFYAGGLMLAYALYGLKVFRILEEEAYKITLKPNVNISELENFNLYLSVLLFASTISLYFAFRGTLTANFTFSPPIEWIAILANDIGVDYEYYKNIRSLLIYPIVVFLPTSLFAGFYMRLTLRKIYLNDVRKKVEEIDALSAPAIEAVEGKNTSLQILEIRKSALELKGKIIENTKVLPLVTFRDAPSVTLAIIVVIQFIWINDAYVKEFFMKNIIVTN